MFHFRYSLPLALLSLSLAAIPAHADTFTTGGYYSGNQNNFSTGLISFSLDNVAEVGAAGNITGSYGSIGGQAVSFSQVFCIDIPDYVYLGSTYTASYSQSGVADGKAVNDAGQIAWLLLNEAPANGNTAANEGLQAAIWQVEYGSSFVMGANSTAVDTDYTNDLAALGTNTASVNSVYWISPVQYGGGNAQAQVALLAPGSAHPNLLGPGVLAATPEPDSLLLLGTGLSSIGLALRLRKRKQA